MHLLIILPCRGDGWMDELIHLSAYTSLPTAMGKWGGLGRAVRCDGKGTEPRLKMKPLFCQWNELDESLSESSFPYL